MSKTAKIDFRLEEQDKKDFKKHASKQGYKSVGDFLITSAKEQMKKEEKQTVSEIVVKNIKNSLIKRRGLKDERK